MVEPDYPIPDNIPKGAPISSDYIVYPKDKESFEILELKTGGIIDRRPNKLKAELIDKYIKPYITEERGGVERMELYPMTKTEEALRLYDEQGRADIIGAAAASLFYTVEGIVEYPQYGGGQAGSFSYYTRTRRQTNSIRKYSKPQSEGVRDLEYQNLIVSMIMNSRRTVVGFAGQDISDRASDDDILIPADAVQDSSVAVARAVNDPYFNAEYQLPCNPEQSAQADRARTHRFRAIPGIGDLRVGDIKQKVEGGWRSLGLLTPEGRRKTFEDTQLEGERHRRLTPRLSEFFRREELRESLMSGIDTAVHAETERLYDRLVAAEEKGEQEFYDMVIIGSGVHGAIAAAHAREQYPDAKILLLDKDEQLGGQFRSYGPNPAFYINSRNRPESRSKAGVPKTDGNINSMGPYAPLQLYDVEPDENEYVDNTVLGDVVAVNGYLSATDAAVRTGYQYENQNPDGSISLGIAMRRDDPLQERSFVIKAGSVIKAFGEKQTSTLGVSGTPEQGYYNRRTGYELFGNKRQVPNYNPLAVLEGKRVAVIAKGDTAKTTIEAIIGALPDKTYGGEKGRDVRLGELTWIGAPGDDKYTVADCLRDRYRQYIGPFLPTRPEDANALISPDVNRAEFVTKEPNGVWKIIYGNRLAYFDVVFDLTNEPTYEQDDYASNVRVVGAASQAPLAPAAQGLVDAFGIPDNTLAIWAKVPDTLLKTSEMVARSKQYSLAA